MIQRIITLIPLLIFIALSYRSVNKIIKDKTISSEWWASKIAWFKILKMFLFIYVPFSIVTSVLSNYFPKYFSTTGNNLIIENFEDAKKIVPGHWVAKEELFDNYFEYNLLILNNNGQVSFAQGNSYEQALNLANQSTLSGSWSINDDPVHLDALIKSQRFLINLDLEGYGNDILRVEIDKSQHRLGRIRDTNDDLRESSGLFTFGGKIFYKVK